MTQHHLGLPSVTRQQTVDARFALALYQQRHRNYSADELDVLREAAAVIQGDTLHMGHDRYARLLALLTPHPQEAAA